MALTIVERKSISRKRKMENKVYEVAGKKVGVREITINCLDHPDARRRVREFAQKLINHAR
tara:strand:- start:1462 stop:1644 length:183 start_codon:yes stop_codon:yes gene_type:complete